MPLPLPLLFILSPSPPHPPLARPHPACLPLRGCLYPGVASSFARPSCRHESLPCVPQFDSNTSPASVLHVFPRMTPKFRPLWNREPKINTKNKTSITDTIRGRRNESGGCGFFLPPHTPTLLTPCCIPWRLSTLPPLTASLLIPRQPTMTRPNDTTHTTTTSLIPGKLVCAPPL